MTGPPILIVEDALEVLRSIRRALGRAEVSNPVLSARTVEQAQQLCSKGCAPLLVLLDYTVGGRCGLDFLEWLRDQPSPLGGTPVIVLACPHTPHEHGRAQALGWSILVRKPPEEGVLAKAISAFGLVRTTVVRGRHHGYWLTAREELRTDRNGRENPER